MKRVLILMLCLLLASCPALADGNFFDPGTYAWVANPDPAGLLNLREHPGTEARSVGKYYNGTLVRLVAEYETSPEWVEVEIGHAYGSACGFMMKRFLSDPVEQPTKSAQPVRVLQQPASLLARPDPAAKTMAVLPAGTNCTVLGYTDGYEHVQANGCLGYIAAQR